ncbi:MAG: hypothetical protein JNK77_05185 [Saprospiraceae bacterium]|nr:hypothetical protein [Saprospiraceae bacterium]
MPGPFPDIPIVPVPAEVIVDLVLRDEVVFIVIWNAGARSAQEVQITFKNPLLGLGGNKNLAELPVFRELTYLAPGKHFEVFVDTAISFFDNNKEKFLELQITWTDAEGKKNERTIRHNLDVYKQLPSITIK